MRGLIAEDEAPQREALRVALAELWPTLALEVCVDGIEALEAIAEQRFDVAFLDIRMPGMNGLKVARELPPETLVVFTTAYDEFAVRAFDAGAIDYVLKPIRSERLQITIARVRERLANGQRPALDTLELGRHGRPAERLSWISASIGDSVRLIPIDDVDAFHAQDKYTRVLHRSGEALIRTPLKDLVAGLDGEAFLQLHRSLIVRIHAISEMRKDELGRWQVILRNRDEWFPMSQALASRFRGM